MSGLLLDTAGTALPEGLHFFKPGWWVIHLLAVVLVFAYGYRKGRRDEKLEQGGGRLQRKAAPEQPVSPQG